MPLPDFTDDEQYLIRGVKSPRASRDSIAWMCGYLGGSAMIAGFAAYHESVFLMLFAFLIVCGMRVYEEHYQMQLLPVWRSIIDKYETSATVCNTPPPKDSDRIGQP